MTDKWTAPKMQPQMIDEFKKKAKKKGAKVPKLAKEYNISTAYAYKLIKGDNPEDKRRKITPQEARFIRNDTRPQKVIAQEYGITQGQVSTIKSGKKYASKEYKDRQEFEQAMIAKMANKLMGW